MSEIPSEFFSKKSFQSLPRLAFLTWLIVFIIDAIILQRFPYSFMRVIFVWFLGMIVSFLFELARYNNMDTVEKADYKTYFMLLNAFIIFLYASSYTGLTKQIGAWGELKSIVNEQGQKSKESGIFLEVQEWAIPIFARQTSYFPDVTAIAENNELKSKNNELRDSLANHNNVNNSKQLEDLIILNSALNQRIITLTNSLNDYKSNSKKFDNNQNSDKTLILENERITNDNNSLKKENLGLLAQLSKITADIKNADQSKNVSALRENLQVLLNRIDDFNNRQAKWKMVENGVNSRANAIKEQVNSLIRKVDPNDNSFYDFIFDTPINKQLPYK